MPSIVAFELLDSNDHVCLNCAKSMDLNDLNTEKSIDGRVQAISLARSDFELDHGDEVRCIKCDQTIVKN